MMTSGMAPVATQNDANLVRESLAGNRDAFGIIVSRYQSLICSLAYSATGSLTQSEDLAQETFLAAWRQLANLREPEKLRAWLCGIARNLINNSLRKQGREPSHAAESIEEIPESQSPESLPAEQTISNEEQAILWRSLERIPEIYREPLVLFYREHQSIQSVAEKLDLTEDTVKQRLSRGRKMLHEQVLAFVEGALERTNPGTTFTLAVLATIPVLTVSAKAATLGATAKSATAAKTAMLAGWFSTIAGPLFGLIFSRIQLRLFMKVATSEEERALLKNFSRKIQIRAVIFAFGMVGLALLAGRLISTYPLGLGLILAVIVAAFVVSIIRITFAQYADMRRLRVQKDGLGTDVMTFGTRDFRTKTELFGLPLVHFHFSPPRNEKQTPVKAWIAGGDIAFGGLFAFGGVSVAPISLGALSFGIFSFGAASVGGIALGAFVLGGYAFGGFAAGWQAFGGFVIALKAAMGGFAVARDFALGGEAFATQANNPAAQRFMQHSLFFHSAQLLFRHFLWFNLLLIIPLFTWWRKAQTRTRTQHP